VKICYHDHFNFDLGLIGHLHPFDGTKFRRVYRKIKQEKSLDFISPESGISQSVISEFVTPFIERCLKNKDHIYRALEIPKIPFAEISFLNKKILGPMRWGVAGTILSTKQALANDICWNLSGGYHHASQHSIEGFCIYNDIGITFQELSKSGQFSSSDEILIIDTDAHHGNGNARTFMENRNITLLDVYNKDIYPNTPSTRERIDIPVALQSGITGKNYLMEYKKALSNISDKYKIAFVVSGTDVLKNDKLGGMQLSLEDVVKRELLTITTLKSLKIPAVILSGGGYSKESANAITQSILTTAQYY
jgi:histone deacetylase 11